jgi:hypothetical protein
MQATSTTIKEVCAAGALSLDTALRLCQALLPKLKGSKALVHMFCQACLALDTVAFFHATVDMRQGCAHQRRRACAAGRLEKPVCREVFDAVDRAAYAAMHDCV